MATDLVLLLRASDLIGRTPDGRRHVVLATSGRLELLLVLARGQGGQLGDLLLVALLLLVVVVGVGWGFWAAAATCCS